MAQTFSGRPLIILELLITGNTPSGNSSIISWQLQARETASQPSWGTDPTRTASVNFIVSGGGTITSTSYAFGTNIPWSYDFRPTGLQTKVIGTGNFTVTHNGAGVGGTVSGVGVANDPTGVLGSADHAIAFGLPDYDYNPVWQSISVPSPAIRGSGYSGQVIASNTGSYSLIGGSMPPGISFNSNGTITGTPTTLGTYSFTFRANGSAEGSTDASRTIVVNPPLPVFSDSTIAGIAIRGVPYSDGVSASDTSSYSIAASSLPTGLSFNTSTGAITGTATETFQTRSPVFRATNVTGSTDTPARSIVVNPPAPVFSDSTVLATASIGSPYSDQVVASDTTSYSVFSGTLPDGLTLNTTTGVISGTPTTAGDSTFVIRATNVTGSADTPSRTITVISPVRVWTGSDFSVGQLNVWDGSDFTIGVLKVWNGTTWVSAK